MFQEYVNTDISSEVDFKMVHEMTLERFRRIESTCDFGVSDYYVEHIQNERLFHAVNHMSANLIEQLVQSISSCLASEAGLAGADLSEGQHNRHTAYVQQEPLGGVQLPIHPQVIEFFKLTWVKPDDSYKYFKQHLNWRNYLMKYIRYELD
ncbi:MAG: hypothetical protein A2X46_15920 [Lentisphaerae bacterium GWF2_57_35]|nr:MAG: hypothetical protein A2X46_15920 [Lentisphaerae bacterium GWF2_57_35]